MSSHHVVRDEQEPALLVLQARLLRIEAIAALLEWSPTIIVPFSEMEELGSMGIKPDVVVASGREEAVLLQNWPGLFPLTVLSPENGDNLLTGLQYLNLHRHKAVNVLSGSQEMIISAAPSWPEGLDVVLYTGSSRLLWRPKRAYRKWLAAGSKLVLHPLEKGSELAVEKTSDETERVAAADHGQIVTERDGIISISSAAAFFVEEFL